MYLICYLRPTPLIDETAIYVIKTCTTADEITAFLNEHRGDGIPYFVLTSTIYPEKR